MASVLGQEGGMVLWEDPEMPSFKVIILGKSGVGKTCVARRLTGQSTPHHHVPTIGLDFSVCTLCVDDVWVRINVWDTAGQERFSSVLPSYCRRAHGALFVFDLTDLRTFLYLDLCLQKAMETFPDNVRKLLVGNKKDLADKGHRAVTSWMAEDWAHREGADYVEVSALETDGQELEAAFLSHVRRLNTCESSSSISSQFHDLSSHDKNNKTKSKCC